VSSLYFFASFLSSSGRRLCGLPCFIPYKMTLKNEIGAERVWEKDGRLTATSNINQCSKGRDIIFCDVPKGEKNVCKRLNTIWKVLSRKSVKKINYNIILRFSLTLFINLWTFTCMAMGYLFCGSKIAIIIRFYEFLSLHETDSSCLFV
jgi:hypothetical protein